MHHRNGHGMDDSIMTNDPVVTDEARHDRDCELAREVIGAQIDALIPGIQDEIAYGEYDADLTSYFDGTMLARVARTFATVDFELAFSRCSDDLLQIRSGIDEFAKDLATKRVEG